MAGSGCALFGATWSFRFLENKKGPKRPHAHRPIMGWPQPAPAVRLGTTTIRSLVILLLISALRLPKGCAEHTGQTRKVKGMWPICVTWRLAGFGGLGEPFPPSFRDAPLG